MQEIWKTIKYCDDRCKYEISNMGRVKSLCKGREKILRLSHTKDGYTKCGISINGVSCRFRVAKLVAEHFIPNPENKPTVNHIDGNKDNNCVDNLEWATLSEQMCHAYETGLKKPMQGTSHKSSKLSEEDVTYIRTHYKAHDKEFGMNALAEKFNVSGCCIKRAVNGITYFNLE